MLESEKLLRASCQEMKKRLDEIKSTNTHLLSDYESLAEKVISNTYLINCNVNVENLVASFVQTEAFAGM